MTRLSPLRTFCWSVLLSLALTSCDEKEEFTSEPVSDYLPLVPGKYITYRLDSLVFTNFGRNTEIRKYQVRHQVDAQITDNLGRTSFRIYRFLRDSAGTEPWQPNGSYMVTPLSDQVEVIDDNLRVIKLHLPISAGFTWRGNRHLPLNPYNTPYNFSNDDNIQDWDFVYDGNPATFTHAGNTYNNVLTVEQVDEAFNVPITSPTSYAARSRSVERYAKNIGLVYREYEMWEYQPNPGGAGGPYKVGFGISMWMIDRN